MTTTRGIETTVDTDGAERTDPEGATSNVVTPESTAEAPTATTTATTTGGRPNTGPKQGVRAMRAYALAVIGLDLVLLTASAIIASMVRFGVDEREVAGAWRGSMLGGVSYELVAVGLTVFCVLVLAGRGAYQVRVFGSGFDEYKRVAGGSVLAAGLVAIVCYLAKIELARGFLAVAVPLGMTLVLLGRYALRKWLQWERRRGRLAHRVLLVGMPAGVGELLEVVRREPSMGYSVVGMCLPHLSRDPGEELDDAVPVLGRIDEVAEVVRRTGVDTVVVAALPGRSSRLLRRLSWSLEGMGVDLVVAPNLTDIAGPRVHVRPVAGLPLLYVEEPEFVGARRLVKVFCDWVGAGVLTVVAMPVFAAIAIAIKLDDGGPILFRQTRVGVDGRQFACLKFRSMVADAEHRLAELRNANEQDGVLFKLRQDPRTTRVGRLLRRLSLDELPQLINVLKGEMSLVGPRPPLPCEVEQYGEETRRRLLVKPGITGLWQVSGRSNLSWEDSVRLDLYYVENWSLSGDLLIVAKTVRAVLAREGAY